MTSSLRKKPNPQINQQPSKTRRIPYPQPYVQPLSPKSQQQQKPHRTQTIPCPVCFKTISKCNLCRHLKKYCTKNPQRLTIKQLRERNMMPDNDEYAVGNILSKKEHKLTKRTSKKEGQLLSEMKFSQRQKQNGQESSLGEDVEELPDDIQRQIKEEEDQEENERQSEENYESQVVQEQSKGKVQDTLSRQYKMLMGLAKMLSDRHNAKSKLQQANKAVKAHSHLAKIAKKSQKNTDHQTDNQHVFENVSTAESRFIVSIKQDKKSMTIELYDLTTSTTIRF